MKFRIRLIPLLLAAAAALLLAGCVNVAGGGMAMTLAVFLVAVLGMGIAACSDDSVRSDAANTDGGWQVGDDVGGHDDSDVSDGDVDDPRDVTDSKDVDDADAGHWESCCVNGHVSSCFCPAHMACNYGWYQSCGDDLCVPPGQSCDGADAGDAGDPEDAVEEQDIHQEFDVVDEPDARDGTWQPCCKNGVIESCFCPGGAICNYGWFHDCGEGTCASGPHMCSEDAGI
jgi:hypothetical protein